VEVCKRRAKAVMTRLQNHFREERRPRVCAQEETWPVGVERPEHAVRMLRIVGLPFARYLVVALLNTLFGYGFFALLIWAGLWYPAAAAASTIGGIIFNFNTTGRLVFGNRDSSVFWRFVGVYAVTYVLGVGLMKAGLLLGVPVLVTAAGIALPMAGLAFLLQRSFVFGRPA
jgi:putative flippase GtrA